MAELLSKYVVPGNKVDIRSIKRRLNPELEPEIRLYETQVYDILSGDRVAVVMPMEKTKLILLPIGSEHDLFFYAEGGLYQCRAKIVDRDKKGGNYLLIMDLISNLRREQRRQYYRFSCALEMQSRVLESEEIQAVEESGLTEEQMMPNLPLKRSIIVDISGGGLRFISNYWYEEGSILLGRYQLEKNDARKEYEVLGKVLAVNRMENRPGFYEHRVQYVNIDNEVREEIIKFIFEEERKNLQKKD